MFSALVLGSNLDYEKLPSSILPRKVLQGHVVGDFRFCSSSFSESINCIKFEIEYELHEIRNCCSWMTCM